MTLRIFAVKSKEKGKSGRQKKCRGRSHGISNYHRERMLFRCSVRLLCSFALQSLTEGIALEC